MQFFRTVFSAMLLLVSLYTFAQSPQSGNWHFTLSRPGGIPVYVQAQLQSKATGLQLVFINDSERITVETIHETRDSLYFALPVFETNFSLRKLHTGSLEGILTKGTSSDNQIWQVRAIAGNHPRVPDADASASYNISGRWAVQFQRADSSWRPAVAEWKQQDNRLTGTIINPSGDYRFLEGAVWGNQVYLSAFDGAHMYAFSARIINDSTMADGRFFSGAAPGNAFKATRNDTAALPKQAHVAGMRAGMESLDFTFPDLDSQWVSIKDPRFHQKIVIVQLMGSWCPNCMDETRFLSDFYNAQIEKEVEIVSLAYELSTDFNRSANSLRKFRQRFQVQYPMLITGARSADTDKAAATLPQLTDIRFFPTTIFINRQGKVRHLHEGFYGPGAPEYFEAYKKEFFDTIETLKKE